MTRKLLILALLSVPAFAACQSGFQNIVDPFLNPDGSAWVGSITYTLAYNTTIAGATIVGAKQQFNVTNGLNICLAPGIYTPVVLQQAGQRNPITTQWGVGSSGPYTYAQIAGAVVINGSPTNGTLGQILTSNGTGGYSTPYTPQGTDTKLLTSGTISGTGATLCTDAQGGATTSGCSGGGGGSPGAPDSSIQFRVNSSTFGGSGNLTWNNTATNDLMTLAGSINVTNVSAQGFSQFGPTTQTPLTNSAWNFTLIDAPILPVGTQTMKVVREFNGIVTDPGNLGGLYVGATTTTDSTGNLTPNGTGANALFGQFIARGTGSISKGSGIVGDIQIFNAAVKAGAIQSFLSIEPSVIAGAVVKSVSHYRTATNASLTSTGTLTGPRVAFREDPWNAIAVTTSTASAASSTITVASALNIVIGQRVQARGVLADTTVTGVSGNVITLSDPTTDAMSSVSTQFLADACTTLPSASIWSVCMNSQAFFAGPLTLANYASGALIAHGSSSVTTLPITQVGAASSLVETDSSGNITSTGAIIWSGYSLSLNTARAVLQTSAINTSTVLGLYPNGTNSSSTIRLNNSNDVTATNVGRLTMGITGASASLETGVAGSGTAPTTLLFGENNTASALLTIGFQFNGVTKHTFTTSMATLASITDSATGLGIIHSSSGGLFTSSAVNLASGDVTGLLPNANLANSSITINTSSPITGGASTALGGSVTIACANCVTVSGGALSGTPPIAISPTGVISAGGLGTVTGAFRGNGSGVVTQAACADLLNAAASCGTDATNATNITSGTLPNARIVALPNANLANSSITVGTTGPLSGGASTALGGTVTLACATCVTSASSLTSNGVMIGGGSQASATIAAATTTTFALFATAGAPAFRALAAGDIPAALSSTTSVNGTSIASGVTLTQTIASGSSALGTSAIASATCATVVTGTATGTATTDDIMADFNADPTAVTGYIASTSGMLTIIKYPTANTVNFKVCNNTSASITPGAITLNWRVVR